MTDVASKGAAKYFKTQKPMSDESKLALPFLLAWTCTKYVKYWYADKDELVSLFSKMSLLEFEQKIEYPLVADALIRVDEKNSRYILTQKSRTVLAHYYDVRTGNSYRPNEYIDQHTRKAKEFIGYEDIDNNPGSTTRKLERSVRRKALDK